MIFDRIVFMETFPTGHYANQKLQVEGTLEPGETVEQAFQQAKAKVESSFKAMNPEVQLSLPVQQVETGHFGDVLREIRSCGSVESLMTYQKVAAQDTEWQKAYDETMKQLSRIKKNGKPVLP